MHQNRRSLLDYTPAEPQRNDRVYAPENQQVKGEGANTHPPHKGGLKSFLDVFSVRKKEQEKIKSDESGNQRDDIADRSSHIPTPVREQSAHNSIEQREYYHDPDKPLLDFVAIIMSVWQRKYLIALLALFAAVIGVLVALSIPHKYYAESQIFLDPRELRLTDRDFSNNPVSSELLLALVDTQMQVATSTIVLENTIDELGLTSDPEFTGNSGGIGTYFKELFSSFSNASKDVNKRVLDQLRKSIDIGRGPKTLVVSLGVSTRKAEKSALIANSLVEQFLLEFSIQKSGFLNQTSSSILSRLDVLGVRLDEAENAIVKYRAANDIIDVGGGVINQKEMLSLSDSLTKIRADQIAKSILAEELSKVDVNAVISGSFPQAALTTTLSEQRKQYSVAKSTSDSLAVGLGPRHPKLVAAQATAKALEADIRDELRRIIAAAQRDAKRTQQSEAELSSQLAVLKIRSSDQSVGNIELEELTRKANSLRTLYEQLLRSSSETAVQGQLSSSKIQVISKAEAPDIPSTTSRKITVILFALGGAMLGIIYAMIIGAWRGIQQNYASQPSAPNMSTAPPANVRGSHYEKNPNLEVSAPNQGQPEPIIQTPLQARHNNDYSMNEGHTQMQTQVYPNMLPHPAAAQHVFVQPAEQEAHHQIVEPHAPQSMSPKQNNDGHTGNSEEYQRLHNEVQRVRARLESWVKQNDRDGNSL